MCQTFSVWIIHSSPLLFLSSLLKLLKQLAPYIFWQYKFTLFFQFFRARASFSIMGHFGYTSFCVLDKSICFLKYDHQNWTALSRGSPSKEINPLRIPFAFLSLMLPEIESKNFFTQPLAGTQCTTPGPGIRAHAHTPISFADEVARPILFPSHFQGLFFSPLQTLLCRC